MIKNFFTTQEELNDLINNPPNDLVLKEICDTSVEKYVVFGDVGTSIKPVQTTEERLLLLEQTLNDLLLGGM